MANSEYIFKIEPIGFPNSLHILVVSNKERSQLLLKRFRPVPLERWSCQFLT